MTQPDGIWMETAEMRTVMRSLAGAGDVFEGEWSGHAGRISAGESGVGTDRIAAAFRPAYQPAADSVRAVAGTVPGSFRAAAGAGDESARRYVATDLAATQAFENLA